ncbi:site-2 protease family protein [Clostridium sp. D53t1_180928_C8]|uniref:site-2 protease family protein n=1 Tax=Clostridium sp. D53t1_180928_C8 TaxID=2787101 RepID=UPI0018ABB182|nr:site-2 protease family protein [Clostridium sp. D53t1_180928_C8]
MEKKKKDIKITMVTIGIYIVLLVAGFFGGILSRKVLARSNMQFGEALISIIIYIGIFIVIFGLHIILHEAGHLIFGLMSGYEFISFRVGSLTLVKDEGKFKFKKFNIKGTGGQCLMMPKTDNYKEVKYVLYNLGGTLMNLIITIVSLVILIAFNVSPIIKFILIASITAGVLCIISNGIPMKVSGIANDGYNIISISKDDFMKYCFYIQLKVNGLLSKGMRIKDMPIEWFYLREGADLNNPLVTSLKIMEGNYYYDNLNFEEAQRCYEEILEKAPKIMKIYEYEINCELLFFEILKGNMDKVKELYTEELRNYIKATSCYISRKRLMYAYNLIVLKDKKKTEKILKEIEKVKKTYPIKGDILSEEEVINFIGDTNNIEVV